MPQQQQEESPTVHDFISDVAEGADPDALITEVLKTGDLRFMDYAFPESEEPAQE